VRKRTGRDVLKLVAFLLLVAGVAYFLFFTPPARSSGPRKAERPRQGLDTLVQSAGPLGPVVFVLIYTIGVLFLPATPFTIAGAVIFGKFHGMVYNLVADTLGPRSPSTSGVLSARGRTRVPRDQDALARPEGSRGGFSVIFYLRIFWFPFIVLNYAAGATRIRFRDYLLGTVLGYFRPSSSSRISWGR